MEISFHILEEAITVLEKNKLGFEIYSAFRLYLMSWLISVR